MLTGTQDMKKQSSKNDIVILGQPFIELYGEQIGSSLKEMLSFKKTVGGSSASIAIGCARLGLRTSLISQVGEDEMGQFIINTLQEEMIDVTQVKKFSGFQTPLILRGTQSKNIFPTTFYSNTQVLLRNENIDSSLINKNSALLISAMNFFIENMNHISRKAMISANENHVKIVLALDHFPSDIAAKDITTTLQTVLPLCDIIIGHEDDFQTATGILNTHSALKHLRTLTNATLVINTEQGGFVINDQIPTPWYNTVSHTGFKVNNHYNYAAKSAFISSFLYGWLEKHPLEKCCEFAMASKVITQSRYDSTPDLPSHDELMTYLSDQNKIVTQMLEAPHFSHIHYASTHVARQEQLLAFNFGYHQQWQKIAQPFNADETIIHHAKNLVALGLKDIAANTPYSSIISDDDIQPHILELFPQEHTIMRSLESPGEIPLRFKGDPDLSHMMLHWPQNHAAKISLIYHPDDRYVLRGQQEATVNLLHRACRAMHHELFIELIPPAASLSTASTISHIMQRFYEIGIYPDWWQIMPPRDQRSWDSITRVINDNDRYCQGVMILGHLATLEQLPLMFDFACKQIFCKGFVIGRSIFQQSLEQWFARRIDDQSLVAAVATSYQKAIDLWNDARQKVEHINASKQEVA